MSNIVSYRDPRDGRYGGDHRRRGHERDDRHECPFKQQQTYGPVSITFNMCVQQLKENKLRCYSCNVRFRLAGTLSFLEQQADNYTCADVYVHLVGR